MNDATATVPEQWGADHFQRSSAKLSTSQPLRTEDAKLIRTVGLPVGPREALRLSLRFETVLIEHQPDRLRSLTDAGLSKNRHYPKTGYKRLDEWLDLRKFVVIGEGPNTFDGDYHQNRFICVESVRGWVTWVYPEFDKGRTVCCLFNTNLPGYLRSLLAYKEYREAWPRLRAEFREIKGEDEEAHYERWAAVARPIHQRFIRQLRTADPEGFESGFWGCHVGNEAILLGIPEEPAELDAEADGGA